MDLKEKPLYQDTLSRFKAQKQEALAAIETCLTNSSKVATFVLKLDENTNLLDEIEKWTAVLADSEEKITVFTTHFGGDQ